MDSKKVIVCDLDGTLAPSKSPLSSEMSDMLCRVLRRHFLAVVSGGSYEQFQRQFLSHLQCGEEELKNLSLFPANGSTCYIYDEKNNDWRQIYNESFTGSESEEVVSTLKDALSKSGIDFSNSYGELIEDRGGQITLSGRGQSAPIEVKEVWDPNQEKRRKIMSLLSDKLSQFDIRIGGISSIDITKKGIDKAYAISKIKQILKVTDDDIVYLGDALFPDGNDSAVKKTNVDYIQPSGPGDTIEILRKYI